MSDNKIHTLGRIDQAIRGINSDGTDDGYIPPQSENGALERIEKSIKEIDIKGIKSGLPKVTNNDNGKVLQVKNGKWGKGEHAISVTAEEFEENYSSYKNQDTIIFVNGAVNIEERLNESVDSEEAAAGKVILNPEWNYVSGDNDYNGWHAFHDEDATGWCTMYPYNDQIFVSRNNLGYLEYTFDDPKLISEISARLQWHCAAHQSAQCEISWDYTVDGEQWLDPSVTGIAESNYIFAQIVNTDTHSDDDYVDATVSITPTEILAIRFKNTYAMCTKNGGANDDYVFMLKNIIFKNTITSESNEFIWYKGIKSGLPKVTNADNGKVLQVKNGKWGKGDIDTPVELITGDIDYNNNVTLSHSGQEIFAMMNDGKLPIIFLEHDSLYGKTYEVYNYTTWYIDSNQEKIFEFTRIRRSEGRTVFWTVPINTVSASNVFKTKSESISNGPTRTTLFEVENLSVSSMEGWCATPGKLIQLSTEIDEFDEIEFYAYNTEGNNDVYPAGSQKFEVTRMLTAAAGDAAKSMPVCVCSSRTTGTEWVMFRTVLLSQSPNTEFPKKTLYCDGIRGGLGVGVGIYKIVGIKY